MEQEPYGVSESKPNVNIPDDDQIKEIIQVHENATQNPAEDGESSQIPQSDSSSPCSSEEDRPIFRRINKEAILKSLSMRRNSVQDFDKVQIKDNNLSYANSALENASRLKQQYYADKSTSSHGVSDSIASDMLVEVSEVSSPPSMDEQDVINGGDSSINPESMEEQEIKQLAADGESTGDVEPIQRVEDEQGSIEASISQAEVEPTDPQEQLGHVQSSTISPTSVLLPTVLSLSSIDRDGDGEISHQESSEPRNASTMEAGIAESANEKLEIQQNDEQPKEIVGNSSSEMVPEEEKIDNSDKWISSLSAEEEKSKQQEIVNGESTQHLATKTSNYADQPENSASHKETRQEQRCLNSTNTNPSLGTENKVQDSVEDEAPVAPLGPVKDDHNDIESFMKNEADRKPEQANETK